VELQNYPGPKGQSSRYDRRDPNASAKTDCSFSLRLGDTATGDLLQIGRHSCPDFSTIVRSVLFVFVL
jgi:hypothetical protein